MTNKLIGLDLAKRDGFNKAITGRVGDTGETYSFRLYNNGVVFDLAQARNIALVGLTPAGYYVDAVGTKKSDGTIEVVIPSAFNSEIGYFQRCFIRVTTTSGEILSTQDLIYYSYGDADISSEHAKDYVARVEALITQINEMADALEKDLTDQFAKLKADLKDATDEMAGFQKQIDDFIAQFDGTPLLFRSTVITTQDWNTITEGGIYTVTNATGANRPTTYTYNGQLEVLTNKVQRYTDITTLTVYIRGKITSTMWNTWVQIPTLNQVYTKTQSDARYAQNTNVYTKTQSDDRYPLISNTYTKTEVDNEFALKTDIVKATQDQAVEATSNDTYSTPVNVKQFYDSQAINRPKFLEHDTNFCAHRGNNSDFPENSSEALRSVTRHRYAEFDVNVTSDGVWMVMHDDTVDRMTNGTGRLDSLTYAQVRALRIDSGANLSILEDWEKVVPSLDEAIKYCKQAGTVPVIEIKQNTYTDTHLTTFMNMLRKHKILNGGCIVITFDKTILERLRNMSNEIELSWVLNSVSQTELNECIRLRMGVDVAYNHTSVTKTMIEAFHEVGLTFGVWTAPDTAFTDLKEKGVDIITTNSRSGDLRWGLCRLDSGFTNNNTSGFQRAPFVEEISRGVFRLYFNVTGGSNTNDARMLILPDWAIPMFDTWLTCNVRNANGSSLATVNVMGKTDSNSGVKLGLGWSVRTSWAAGVLIYPQY